VCNCVQSGYSREKRSMPKFGEGESNENPGICLIAATGIFSSGGGIASVNRLVVRSLIEEGYRVDIFALVEQEVRVPDYATDRINYRVFCGDKIAFTLALWRAQISTRYALIFSDHINVAAALAPTRLTFNSPYMVWVHGNEIFPPNPTWEGKIGLRLAEKRITSSGFTRDKVQQYLPSKTTLSCDLALEPDRWGFSLPDNPPGARDQPFKLKAVDSKKYFLGEQVILHVGRMASSQRYKGHEELMRAFPQILLKNPNAQLVLAGTGDDYAYLKEKAHGFPLPVQRAIFLPGFVSDADLAKLFRQCFLFAMPSQQEGFGIVYLEAMRWAKPCIGSRIDAASCVIVEGETGMLVENPKSHEEIAANVNWLLTHPNKAKKMGISGYHLVRNRYLFPEFKERLFQVLAK
jgi:phosphatidylinositol alpha-1,6-mannosyltransferase